MQNVSIRFSLATQILEDGVAGQVCKGTQGGGHDVATARDGNPYEEVRGETNQVGGPYPGEMVHDVGHAGAAQESLQQLHGGAGDVQARLDGFKKKSSI